MTLVSICYARRGAKEGTTKTNEDDTKEEEEEEVTASNGINVAEKEIVATVAWLQLFFEPLPPRLGG